jgi:mannose-6-phosphate isomerase-like protein (cupin superfamily)
MIARSLILSVLVCATAMGQVTRELPTNRERGFELSTYSRCWQDSDAEISHGGLLERPIFTAGDPQHVTKPGAVLVYAKTFSRAALEPESQTQATTHSDQEILYVVTGIGWIEGGGRRTPLEDGTVVLLPPGMEHLLANTGKSVMELLIVTETPKAGFRPRADMLVHYVRQLPVTHIAHWSYAVRWLFKEEDGLANLSNLLIVTQDAMTIGSPHAHIALWEEVWYKIEDDALMYVGSEIRKRRNGCGYLAPPDGQTPHSVINASDKPTRYFYFAYYKLDQK